LNTFNGALKAGQIHEDIVLKKIQNKYPQAYRQEGYCKGWDIYVPELSIRVEVKSDQKSQYTGNIVIETEFNGKPSALTTTKAQYWVIFDGDHYVWFKVGDIRRCIKENDCMKATFIGKGDIHSKRAYLIKKELLYKYKSLSTNSL
tara:strand:+ start:569 stop:1006 length:438 start_codon:yes stop_codon:yes gene_type:complete